MNLSLKLEFLFLKIEFRIEVNKKLLRVTNDEICTIIYHFYHILLVTLNKYENIEKNVEERNVEATIAEERNVEATIAKEKNVENFKMFIFTFILTHRALTPINTTPVSLC